MRRFTLEELEAMPTLCVGQAADLKVESDEGDGIRIWLSRCGVADGEPYENKVSVEKYVNLRWQEVSTYQAK
jgi:hypothetical protein